MNDIKTLKTIKLNGPSLCGELNRIVFDNGAEANIFVPKGYRIRNIYDVMEELNSNIEEKHERRK